MHECIQKHPHPSLVRILDVSPTEGVLMDYYQGSPPLFFGGGTFGGAFWGAFWGAFVDAGATVRVIVDGV